MTAKQKANRIAQAAEDMKADQIEILDVGAKTSMAEFFVICGGTSDRHVDSIADKVVEKMKELKVRPLRSEGEHSGWTLIDFGDVIFHVMREEQRQFYSLEEFWKTKSPDSSVADA